MAHTDDLIDWELATTVAGRAVRTLGPGPTVTPDRAAAAVVELRALADEALGHVSAASGLTAPGPVTVEVLDRAAWSAAAVASTRVLMAPVGVALADRERPRAVAAVGRRVLGAEVGGLTALLASRVLGQWDPTSERLLLIAPNIVAAEQALGVPERDFRLWVCLHEQTHALQFTGVPWLRPHFFGLVERLAVTLELDPRQLAVRVRRALADPGDLPRLTALVAGPAQREVLTELQALMTVLEGHAEHVMDVAGEPLLPSLPLLRAGLEERRRTPGGPLTWLLRRVLGFDAKMAQYAKGKEFCDAVAERAGAAGLATVWESADALPTAAEIAEPTAWLRRVLGAHVRG